MLYSKANLKVAGMASANPYDGALCGVQFDADGGTAACNGNALVAVGPARADVHFPDVGPRATPSERGSSGVVLKPDHVSEAEGIIPRDKRVSLQHVAMTKGADVGKVEFTTIDKTGRVRRVADWPKRERFPDWKGVVRKAGQRTDGGSPVRVCVGRKDLLAVLKTVADACGGTENEPVYLEIGAGVIVRAHCRETGQRVVGVASAFGVKEGEWLPKDEWEKTIEGEQGATTKTVRRIGSKA